MDLLHSILAGGLIGVITGIVGLYIALQKLRPEKRVLDATADKIDAEKHEVLGKAWADLVLQLQNDLGKANEDLKQLRTELDIIKEASSKCETRRQADRQMIRVLRQQVSALMSQMKEAGIKPIEVPGIRDILAER